MRVESAGLEGARTRLEGEVLDAIPRHVVGAAPVPQPDREGARSHAARGADLLDDLSDDPVVAVPVSSPGRHHQHAPARRGVDRFAERLGDGIPMLVRPAVGQTEEDRVGDQPHDACGVDEFSAAEQGESGGAVRRRLGVRAFAVGDDEEVDPDAACDRGRDQPRRSQALVVGVRGDNDQVVDVQIERWRVAAEGVRPDALVGPGFAMVEAHHVPAPVAMSAPILAASRSPWCWRR